MNDAQASLPLDSDLGNIPDKLYFKIGEVASLVGVQAHVLRYWEKEVPLIRPGKSASNQRRYRRKDVEIFREIRRLLYQERYTLAGAKKRLASGRPQVEAKTGSERVAEQTQGAGVLMPLSPAPGAGSRVSPGEGVEAIRGGLEELIRMCGEEP